MLSMNNEQEKIEKIARLCHEVNVAYCKAIGDPWVSWEDAPETQKNSARKGVQYALEGVRTPEEMHESWLAVKRAEGWVYGAVRDDDRKVHPCMLPYHLLPQSQKVKDYLFQAVVRNAVF